MGVLIHLESNKLKKGQKKIAPPDAKRYAVCGMQDKPNPFPRVNSPLYFPEDPEFGFSSASSGPSRRKFLKRTGGATLGTLMAWHTSTNQARGHVSDVTSGESYNDKYEIRYVRFNTVPDKSRGTSDTWIDGANERLVAPRLDLEIKHDNDHSTLKNFQGKPAWGVTAKSAISVVVKEWGDIFDDFTPENSANPKWRKMSESEYGSWRGTYNGEPIQDSNSGTAWVRKNITPSSGLVTDGGSGVGEVSDTHGIHLGLVWINTVGDAAVLEVTFGRGSNPANETKTIDVPFEVRATAIAQ